MLPLSEPLAMATGNLPTVMGELGNSLEGAVTVALQNGDLIGAFIDDGEVGKAVTVEVGHSYGDRLVTVLGRRKGDPFTGVNEPSPLPLKTE